VTAYPPPEPGFCVCGRQLDERPLSEWACSEPCQSAWLHHNADPEVYPHPREIRESAERRAGLVAAAVTARRFAEPGPVPEGTEINVDGEPFVRVGAYWRPAGMWEVLRAGLAETAAYRRWCPRCRQRIDSVLYPATDRQECAVCGHQWPGRPLLGQIERRGDPWPGMRMRLFDGQRSAVFTFHEQALNAEAEAVFAGRVERWWLRLERQLCGGYADVDQPNPQQMDRQERRLRRARIYCEDLAP
jgi:hypothetical protein